MLFKNSPSVPLLLVLLTIFAVAGIAGAAFLGIPEISSLSYQAPAAAGASTTLIAVPEVNAAPKPAVIHLSTPTPVKAIYMSQCVVGTLSFRNDLVKLIDETELNAVVIDIKDYTGKLAFTTDNPELKDAVSDACGARDMRSFLSTLHEKGIYTIARVTVFQDPHRVKERPDLAVKRASDGAVWKDYKGLNFIDAGAKDHWEYTALIAREAYALGFDEINFDYIRFPSDGNMKDIHFSFSDGRLKHEVLRDFFRYLHEELSPEGIVISADLFGMVTTNTDDLNIGQVLEDALPYFDFVAPMVYPSHYPPNFNGWKNPNTVPYALIKYVMETAVHRANVLEFGTTTIATSTPPSATAMKLRPWLQDFDYGGTYDVAEVKAQIKATYDVGLDSWMLWAPSNRYTRGALIEE